MALHGRDEDLALIDAALTAAAAGRGNALFFTGEAGIGKSTLIAETRARAGSHTVLAGAAWEAGGAPPYWPWQQVLRDAAGHFGARVASLPGADRIAALVPEWGRGDSAGPDAPDPGAARFALLDAVMRALVALSGERPLVILLDDLHAADLPTLDLLVMLVRELPRGAIALIAAWREGELAVRADAATRLARAARHGTVQPLRRLTADEVATWVGAGAAEIHASSEGNPLFVEELVRAQRGGLVGHGIASVLEANLALLSPPTRELLATASVLGRELDPALIQIIAGIEEDAIAAALREAAGVGIVESRPPSWRFRHVLLRDHLYDALPPTRRAALHGAVGAALADRDPVRAARHLLDGGAGRAVSVARTAATRAMTIYAFEDAAELLRRALEAHRAEDALAIDLRCELAAALYASGQGVPARAECVIAAEHARRLGDPDRFASAALGYASELITGRRDPQMVALLEEAAAGLAPIDSTIRARVTARLAAALVPAFDGDAERPEHLAREARLMARRIGDDATTMFVMRYVAHAHGYRMGIADARAISREVIELSDRLQRPLEALEHRTWIVGGCLAEGDLAAAAMATTELETLLARLPQPHYRFRMPLLRASDAIRRGQLDEARRWLAIVFELAREHAVDRAWVARVFGELSVMLAWRSPELGVALLDDARKIAKMVGTIAKGMLAAVLAIAGLHGEAREQLTPDVFEHPILLIQFGAEAVLLADIRELAPLAAEKMLAVAAIHPLAQGPLGSLMIRPAGLCVGELLLMIDRVPEAIVHLEAGLALARKIEAVPFIANGAAALARALERRAGPGNQARARELAAEALRLGVAIGMHGFATARTAPELSIKCGEDARVRWRGRELVVPAAKGMEYLAALIATSREIHVSDLAGDDDRGDAGEVLDAKARGSYKARAEELRGELDAAREANDLGRIERLTTELDAITDELLAGTGLGGRARKAGSRIERARVNVQRRIKDAIRRLAIEDAALGRYLEATIKTGTFCSYVPLES